MILSQKQLDQLRSSLENLKEISPTVVNELLNTIDDLQYDLQHYKEDAEYWQYTYDKLRKQIDEE